VNDANQTLLIQLGFSIVTLVGLILTYLKSNQAVKTGMENKEALKEVHVQINGHTEAVVKATSQVAALTAKALAEGIASAAAKIALAESETKVAKATELGREQGRAENK
jgi:ribosome-associated protein YbcJ (S4-like RNA binding protein)